MRRRRGRFVLLAAIAAALYLLLGGPGVPRPRPAADPGLGVMDRQAVAPDAPPASRPETASAPSSVPADGAAADREASQRARIERALHDGRVGVAWTTLAEAVAQATTPIDREQLATFRRAVERGLAERLAELDARIREGRILEARLTLGALREGDVPEVRQAIEAWQARAGWPPPPVAPAASAPAASAPAAEVAPLVPGRFVRFAEEQDLGEGWVASLDPGRVTVRVAAAAGVRFPSVPNHQVEPIQPSAEEALALARQGPPELRWLWRAHLHARGMGDDPRVRELR